jgi:hypothetical protein
MKISNIDTLSAYLDRLIVERIKWFFFKKDGNSELMLFQEDVVAEIKRKIMDLLDEPSYYFKQEKRTFKQEFLVNLDELIVNNIHIGESDRVRLKEVKSENPNLETLIIEEKRLRTANEERSKNKNEIDKLYKEFRG